MKDSSMILDLFPVETESVSAHEFARLLRESPSVIKESHFVAPAIGSRSFGSFSVTYSRPIYKTLNSKNSR